MNKKTKTLEEIKQLFIEHGKVPVKSIPDIGEWWVHRKHEARKNKLSPRFQELINSIPFLKEEMDKIMNKKTKTLEEIKQLLLEHGKAPVEGIPDIGKWWFNRKSDAKKTN